MAKQEFDYESYLDVVAQAHGLKLEGERRAEVLVQLKRIHGMVQSVLEFPLDDHVEPAPTYLPAFIPAFIPTVIPASKS